MPSSISSSSSAMSVSFKTLWAGVLLFGLVLGAYNLAVYGLKSAGADLNGRVSAQINYLPTLIDEIDGKDAVMVFGSSMVQAGFEPLLFDGIMAEKGLSTISYNYGIGNLNPYFQDYLSRRIKDQFQQGRQKLKLAIIEFNPFQTTTVRKNAIPFTDEQNLALLMSNKELFQVLLENPTKGIRLLNIRYLRQGYSAELFSSLPLLIASEMQPTAPRTEEYREAQKKSQQANQAFRELVRGQQGDGGFPPWDPSTRGGRMDKSQFTQEILDSLRDWMASRRYVGFLQDDLDRRIRGADIEQLNFDEELIESFIAIVKDFQEISEEVVVVLLPRNTDWVKYTPEVQAKLNQVNQRIQTSTGADVKNYQVIDPIGPEHFNDTTHLSWYDGNDIFTEFLAEEFHRLINEQ